MKNIIGVFNKADKIIDFRLNNRGKKVPEEF